MDREQRNLLRRAVAKARKLLEGEVADQLEGVYNILPDGAIRDAAPGDPVIRARLVDLVMHHRASGSTEKQAVERATREMAFTTFNRFVALKMCEKRGLVRECVSRGLMSDGVRELADGAPGMRAALADGGYRLILEAIMDELSLGLKVLFDRRGPHSSVWPRPVCLEELLAILNAPELADLWAGDETIGWVYQYFNSKEEREDMREESGAPRDSYELAVRNQFFTPRYVVEFLTDNTLGRTWYEMTRGESRVKEKCRYLMRQEGDIFLERGENAPPQENFENISQEELLKQQVVIPYRALKDPRTILMLDPACGSMHFGLYAFNVFELIYQEAWELEEKLGAESMDRPPELKALHDTYANVDEFLQNVPRLIIEFNLHGIDIDPRCVQIAGLSLWLRAQSAWERLGLKPEKRPTITRSNIVCAEPMPGEKELLREFVELEFPLEKNVFKWLLERVSDGMQLAGEAGSLLKIEEEIRAAIVELRTLWNDRPQFKQSQLFADVEPGVRTEHDFDFGAIADEKFWESAESHIYKALRDYAGGTEIGQGVQRRLFAEDAARGFAFIDVCRKRYDVVLMNPPFGKCSTRGNAYYESEYSQFKSDIGIAFVDRFLHRTVPTGCVGAITSRAFLASDSLKEWREKNLLEKTPIHCLVDLGYGVLDGAMVEAAAYVVDAMPQRKGPRPFIRVLESREKERSVRDFFTTRRSGGHLLFFLHDLAAFRSVPLSVVCYWLPASLLRKLQNASPLKESGGVARHGLVTTDDYRFLRATWEVPATQDVSTWKLLAKGGEYQPFWDDLHICVDWSNNGEKLKVFLAEKRLKTQGSADWTPWLNHSEYYLLEGLTYPERTTSDFCPRVLPRDVIFSSTGQAIQFGGRSSPAFAYLCGSFTRFFRLVIESFVGSGDNAFPGSAAKHYRSGLLNQLPAPLIDSGEEIERIARDGIQFGKSLFEQDETARNFVPPCRAGSIQEMVHRRQTANLALALRVIRNSRVVERIVADRFVLSDEELAVLDEIIGPHPESYSDAELLDAESVREFWLRTTSDLVEICVQKDGPRRQLTKKSFIAHRKLELICHALKARPDAVVRGIESSSCIDPEAYRTAVAEEVSFAVGCSVGRWDIRYATGEKAAAELSDPFAPLPACAPGQLQNGHDSPARPQDVPAAYPIPIPWDGILVDDPDHPLDMERRIREVIGVIWRDSANDIEREACQILKVRSLREYCRKPAGFFADHLKRYSKSRRQAPIYWPLSTNSGVYVVWVYYHRLTSDTLYKIVTEYLGPKIGKVEDRIAQLEAADLRREPRAATEAGKLTELLTELKEMREELLRIVRLPYKPNLNDGVQISAAPLRRLFRLPRWRSELEATWRALEKGEYDWAHLAYAIWPDRVKEKCRTDKSLAIAHGLEEVYEELIPEGTGEGLRSRRRRASGGRGQSRR